MFVIKFRVSNCSLRKVKMFFRECSKLGVGFEGILIFMIDVGWKGNILMFLIN